MIAYDVHSAPPPMNDVSRPLLGLRLVLSAHLELVSEASPSLPRW